MKNKLKILCILMLLCLCGCVNKNNKEITNNNENTSIYNSNDIVEDKQDENIENDELKQDTNTTNEKNKEEQIQENKTTTSQKQNLNSSNKNNTTNNNEINVNNNNNNNEVSNDSTIENEENKEDLPSEDETENNLENDLNNDNNKIVYLDIYYYDSCSYCHQLFSFLDNLDENLKSKLVITKYDVKEYNSEFNEAVNKFSGNITAGTPYTVFNNQKAIMGYSKSIEQKYLKYINEFIN